MPCRKNNFQRSLVFNQEHCILFIAMNYIYCKISMPIFQANFPKNRASNKGPPTNIEKKNQSYIKQKHLEFLLAAISSRLQRIVHCFLPYFHAVWKYQPSLASYEPRKVLCPGQCIIKVLSIPNAVITVYRVNSLVPTDFATLASQDGDSYR